jgi:Ca-activated chloride channel homolog
VLTTNPKPLRVIQRSWSESCSRILGPALKFLFLTLLLLVTRPTAAQVAANRADILPPGRSAPELSARQVIRSNVDLVLVDVTVLDHSDRAITGLEAPDFSVQEDNSRQTIRYLSNVDQPISLVIVFDASASMVTKIQEERNAVKQIIKSSNPQDDFSLVVVRSQPQLLFQYDDPEDDIQRRLDFIQPDGFTALWDGMYLALNELRSSHYDRKAIIVISDGGNNHSKYTESEIKSLLEEADVEVYALGIFDRFAKRIEEKTGPLQLDEISSMTGGRMFSVHDTEEISHAVAQISSELRNQYVLGYYSNNRDRNGKWRKLKIRLAGSAAGSKLRLYAKKGYYAPTEPSSNR